MFQASFQIANWLFFRSEDSSLDELEIDLLEDADFEKDIFRTKSRIFVSDLSRKSSRVLAKKATLYHWNLMTIGTFYGLPVVQLVLTYQNVTNSTGNQVQFLLLNTRCKKNDCLQSVFTNYGLNKRFFQFNFI